ncbi:siderophore-interacting protein [Cellulomonas sp. NPDC055163]
MPDAPTTAASPTRARPAPVRAAVLRTERVAEQLVRVVLGGPGLRAVHAPTHADSYVKVVFVPPAALAAASERPDGRVDLDALRASLPAEDQPRVRAYTVRAFDAASAELTIDVVVHGDEGVAGPWAASARPGDEVLLLGPGGAYSPDPAADRYLLVGDASALPAVAVVLERLAAEHPDAVGDAILEVHGPGDELPLTAPAGVRVRWVHQGTGVVGLRLVEAVRDLAWPDGRVDAFVHGEAGTVKELRHHLRVERGLPRTGLSISGYWRLGAADEDWRASKKDWARSIEDAEQAAGLD